MPSDTQNKPKPPSRVKINLNGVEREIFMSFGLLGELTTLVGGPEAVPKLSFDTSLAQTALHAMLAQRDARGAIIEPEDGSPVVPYDMDSEVAETLLDWVGDHVLDFFIRRFAKSAKLFATQADQLAAVGSSLTSSKS